MPFIGNSNLKIACPACKTSVLTIESNTVLAELLKKGGLTKVECHHSVIGTDVIHTRPFLMDMYL